MDEFFQFAVALLYEQQDAYGFDAAASGAAAGADEGDGEEGEGDARVDAGEAFIAEAGGGGDRDYLQYGAVPVLAPIVTAAECEQRAYRYERYQDKAEKELEFAVVPIGAEVEAAHGGEVHAEIHRRYEHEYYGDPIDGGVVAEMRQAGVVGREATDGYGAEAVGDGVEAAHAGEPVSEGAEYGEADVNAPQGFGGLRDPRGYFASAGAGDFAVVKLHSADAKVGQYRDREHDDAHAADPLQ